MQNQQKGGPQVSLSDHCARTIGELMKHAGAVAAVPGFS
jgi:hypothetical protein